MARAVHVRRERASPLLAAYQPGVRTTQAWKMRVAIEANDEELAQDLMEGARVAEALSGFAICPEARGLYLEACRAKGWEVDRLRKSRRAALDAATRSL